MTKLLFLNNAIIVQIHGFLIVKDEKAKILDDYKNLLRKASQKSKYGNNQNRALGITSKIKISKK